MRIQESFRQCTIKKSVKVEGITVHHAENAELVLAPAPVDTGVVFLVNIAGKITEIPARSTFVGDTRLSTSLVRDGVKISTVEHLLSAVSGLGVDNLYIHVNAHEIPIMDGSAAPFVDLILKAGIETQHAFKKYVRIKKTVEIMEGDKRASIAPYHGFKVTCEIDYDQNVIKQTKQRDTIDFSSMSFVEEISRARTFGLLSEYEQIRAMNLARGASLDNAVVVDDKRVLNEGGLRYNNEFVRHKILDAIGDLFLIGAPLLGAFEGYKSGHAINDKLVKAILADESAWEYVTAEHDEDFALKFNLKSSLAAA